MQQKDHYLKKELYESFSEHPQVFDFLQEAVLDGVWYWNLEQPEHEWMSDTFWQTLGYDPKDKKHRASEWKTLIHPNDLVHVELNFKKHLEDPEYPFDQLVRYTHQNGSIVWVRCRGFAIRASSGKPVRMLGAHTNVTPLMHSHQSITALKKEYETVFNGSQDALFLIKVNGPKAFSYVRNNLSHQTKTGLTHEMISDKTPQELLGETLGDLVILNYQRCVDAKKPITYEEELNLPAGERVWQTTLTPIFENEKITHLVGSAIDVTAQKRLEKELDYLAHHDFLTKLPNRLSLHTHIQDIADSIHQFTLLYIDINNFKQINDTYGHQAGDEVLKAVAKRLRNHHKKSDFTARLGGDEFVVIKHDDSHHGDIEHCVAAMKASLHEDVEYEQQSIPIKVAMGYASYPQDGLDFDQLLRQADRRMYHQKQAMNQDT